MQGRTLLTILKDIDTLIYELRDRRLTREEEIDLSKLMLTLQLQYSSQHEFHEGVSSMREYTQAYIYAHRNMHQDVHSLATSSNYEKIVMSMIVKGYNDGGNGSAAESLVRNKLMSIHQLASIYKRFHLTSALEALEKIRVLQSAICQVRANPDCKKSIAALQEAILASVATNKFSPEYAELLRLYQSITPSSNISIFNASLLVADLKKLDPLCAAYLDGKCSREELQISIEKLSKSDERNDDEKDLSPRAN